MGLFPHFLHGGTIINISPLRALMEDQQRTLRKFSLGLKSCIIMKDLSLDVKTKLEAGHYAVGPACHGCALPRTN